MGPSTKLNTVKLRNSTRKIFQSMGVKTVGEVAEFTQAQLKKRSGVGESTLSEIENLVLRAKLTLAEPAKNGDGFSPLKQIPLEALVSPTGISTRAFDHLRRIGIRSLYGLTQRSPEQLELEGIEGEVWLRQITKLLKQHDLALKEGKHDRLITECELSVRSRKTLHRLGIKTFRDLVQKTEQELREMKCFGETSLNEIKAMLDLVGLSLAKEGAISGFELSVRSRNCLRQMRITTLGELEKVSESELLAYKGFGQTSLWEIKSLLTSRGLSLLRSAHGRYRPEMVQEAKRSGVPISVPQRDETPDEVEPNPAHRANMLDVYGECCQSVRMYIRDDEGRKVEIEITSEGGTIFITPRDHVHGDVSEPDYKLATDDGFGGHPIFLKLVNGRVKLFAFPSKANNVPVVIDMEGAKELRRWS